MSIRGRYKNDNLLSLQWTSWICEYATCEHKIHVRVFQCADGTFCQSIQSIVDIMVEKIPARQEY